MSRRLWQHVPVGLINAVFYAAHPLLGLGFTVAWLAYEFRQDANSAYPDSHKDILGMVWGLGVGLSVVSVLIFVGVV